MGRRVRGGELVATAATKYDDMNIDWGKVHDGDKLETQETRVGHR